MNILSDGPGFDSIRCQAMTVSQSLLVVVFIMLWLSCPCNDCLSSWYGGPYDDREPHCSSGGPIRDHHVRCVSC